MNYHQNITRYYYGINAVYPHFTTIFLYNENKLAGRIYFEPASKIKLSPHRFESGHPVLYFRQSMMVQIVDMLRNEAPIWLWAIVNGTQISNAVLGTDYAEPTGEGEGVRPN